MKSLSLFNIDTNHQIFDEAVPVLIDMGLVGKSQKRTRRPTSEELKLLRLGLEQRESFRPNEENPRIPFIDILEFSILTCMRIGEVCKPRWEDLNQEHKTILVRDRKDPRKKEGNHMIVPLLGESFEIALKQPGQRRTHFSRITRYEVLARIPKSKEWIGHWGLEVSRLTKGGSKSVVWKGYSIEEVAQVTDIEI